MQKEVCSNVRRREGGVWKAENAEEAEEDGNRNSGRETEERFITVVQKLETDTIMLKETKVYPWPSREQFKHAFLNADIPNDDIERAKYNINNVFVDIMIAEMPNDGKENFKYFMNDIEQQQYIMMGNPTIIPILNPFAWAAFIEAWRNGDFKRKDW